MPNNKYPDELVEKVTKAILIADGSAVDQWTLTIYSKLALAALEAAGVEPPLREFKFGDKVRLAVSSDDAQASERMLILDTDPDDGALVAWRNGDTEWIATPFLTHVDED